MIRVYIADARLVERSALRLMLLDLNMEIAGEAGDWSTALAETPTSRTDMLMVDWELLPAAPSTALAELRKACLNELIILLLISPLEVRQQAAHSIGADVFISKADLPERVAELLRTAATKVTVIKH